MLKLTSSLGDLQTIAAKEVVSLIDAGFRTVKDLLDHYPRRYEDRRRFDAYPAEAGAGAVCLRGTVIDTRNRFGGRMRFYEAIVADTKGAGIGPTTITCRWFNMPYLSKVLAAGQDIVFHGKPKLFQERIVIDHPEFEVVTDDSTTSIHLERVVPIYRNVSGISQRRLRELIHKLLQETPLTSQESYSVDPTYPWAEALAEIHFPSSIEQAEAARRRFALEEFFEIQLNVVWRRTRQRAATGRSMGMEVTLLTNFYENLPFDLTAAQKRSIKEIVGDMRKKRPMNRLLQGDVGSGKTLVAVAAILMAVDSGVQAALMAPTQILAEQHYLTFKKLLQPLGVKVALRTASRHEENDSNLNRRADIIVGTHALLYDESLFDDLGFIVIDEQHKFGVIQRGKLIDQGVKPDLLVMTATPIPRTLTMTIYGDLDVSILDERPGGRGKLITALRIKPKQLDINRFVKEQLVDGRQAYLVYPLVEDSESLKVESATAAFAKWSKRLSSHSVELIHGRTDTREKEAIMGRFRAGDTSVLVATTVIEVGVDVPNANLMIIHHAERFGLAQLHQLRGRVGRGPHKSYCILVTDSKNPEALEKLSVLAATSDGFQIAEEDLRMRGPGEVLGTAQSGLGELRFAEYLADVDLLREARALADQVISEDPELSSKHSGLWKLIDSPELPATARG